MHLVIGGAFNGKQQYVIEFLQARKEPWTLLDVASCVDLQKAVNECTGTIVIQNVHEWLAATEQTEAEAIAEVLAAFKNRQTIIVLTEIGRGIVPLEPHQREWRDAVGRLYQQLFRQADEITRVWYGLAKTLKKRGESK